jgi:hypothetical protein
MKKIFYLAIVLISAQACSVSQSAIGSGPKNLIQNSEFAIVTPKHDTLFLCNEDFVGKLLANCWAEGKFNDGPQPTVIVLNCQNFEKLAQRISAPGEMLSSTMKP